MTRSVFGHAIIFVLARSVRTLVDTASRPLVLLCVSRCPHKRKDLRLVDFTAPFVTKRLGLGWVRIHPIDEEKQKKTAAAPRRQAAYRKKPITNIFAPLESTLTRRKPHEAARRAFFGPV